MKTTIGVNHIFCNLVHYSVIHKPQLRQLVNNNVKLVLFQIKNILVLVLNNCQTMFNKYNWKFNNLDQFMQHLEFMKIFINILLEYINTKLVVT